MSDRDWEIKKSLGLYAEEWLQKRPKADFLRTCAKGSELTNISYGQVYRDTTAWCKLLSEKGIREGDRVAMISPKTVKHFTFFYSAWFLGAIAVPVCETLGDPEMSFIIKDCGAKLVIADKAFESKVRGNAGDTPVICLDDMPWGTDTVHEIKPRDMGCDAVAVLIYTSGSTGMPKGVMLTHRNVWTNAYWAVQNFEVRTCDSLISLLPYWHSYALVCEILCVAMRGAVCCVPRDIRDFQKNLGVYQPTLMIAVPRVVEAVKMRIDKQLADLPPKKKALVDKAIYNASRIFTAGPKWNGGMLRMLTHYCFYDPLVFKKFRAAFGGKLRFVVCGGAPMDLELQIFYKYLGVTVLVGYGLTETSPVISANLHADHRLGSCGRVFQWLRPEYGGDYTFKDDEGNMGKDVRGRLMVKGDCVMKGYWNHTDASAKTFEDGWLNTGDMGYCDKEGFLFIQGRQGNMIVMFGGEKLHPEHVEDAVKMSTYITEAMVIGEKCKSVYVCVNVNPDMVKGMSEEEIHAKIKSEVQERTAHLAAFQRPREVLILPPFSQEDGTMTATLKIRRFKIWEKYRDQIEKFLQDNGETIATRHELGIASSRILESLEKGEAVVGNGVVIK